MARSSRARRRTAPTAAARTRTCATEFGETKTVGIGARLHEISTRQPRWCRDPSTDRPRLEKTASRRSSSGRVKEFHSAARAGGADKYKTAAATMTPPRFARRRGRGSTCGRPAGLDRTSASRRLDRTSTSHGSPRLVATKYPRRGRGVAALRQRKIRAANGTSVSVARTALGTAPRARRSARRGRRCTWGVRMSPRTYPRRSRGAAATSPRTIHVAAAARLPGLSASQPRRRRDASETSPRGDSTADS